MAALRRFAVQHSVGLLALFVALGGTSYAVTRLPANSVGTAQLNANSVTSAKIGAGQVKARDIGRASVGTAAVIDGSLLARDFGSGQLPAGPVGPAGLPGAKGDTGAAGAPGAKGDTGATGSIGLTGLKGDKGDKGDTGNTGLTGPSTGTAGGDLTGNYPNPTIAGNAVNGGKVSNESLTGADVSDATLTGDDVLGNSLTGSDIDETTLSAVNATTLGNSAPSAFAGIGRSGTAAGCTDDDGLAEGSECGTATITLPRTSRLLVMASGEAVAVDLDDGSGAGFQVDDTSLVEGTCFLKLNNVQLGPTHGFQLRGEDVRDAFSYVAVNSTGLAPGTHTISLQCFEADGDIDWSAIQLTAVALSGD